MRSRADRGKGIDLSRDFACYLEVFAEVRICDGEGQGEIFCVPLVVPQHHQGAVQLSIQCRQIIHLKSKVTFTENYTV